MDIKRSLSVHGNYNTGLYNVTKNIPKNILYHNQHNLREPFGIYIISSNRVFSSFKKILYVLNNNDSKWSDIDAAHKELLDSILAFIDDGYHIMKCLYKKSRVDKEILFADKWLMQIDKKIITDFKEMIKPYREKTALIDNKIKHNHARYCHIEMSTMYGKVKGYYIEGVTCDGVIQPDKKIHKMYNNEHTAISYNKDIRYHLVNFYCLSNCIANTVLKIIKNEHSVTIDNKSCEYDDNEKILDVIKSVNSIKSVFFPDEYNEELPQIIINENNVEFKSKSYSSYRSKLYKPKNMKIMLLLNGDEVTKSWSIPYFKGEN